MLSPFESIGLNIEYTFLYLNTRLDTIINSPRFISFPTYVQLSIKGVYGDKLTCVRSFRDTLIQIRLILI